MAKYIPLDAAVAEIERLKEEALQKKGQCKRHGLEKIMHQISAYNKVLSSINSLEVREVDLDKPFEGVKVQTSWESGSLDEIIVTTKYKAQKGEKAW